METEEIKEKLDKNYTVTSSALFRNASLHKILSPAYRLGSKRVMLYFPLNFIKYTPFQKIFHKILIRSIIYIMFQVFCIGHYFRKLILSELHVKDFTGLIWTNMKFT
jgi:hypothetical protein